ncbi:MAG: hypothetical protein CVU62_12385 [Deltaproteobacteria bacterium HGW-Deltaproteobacteria-2]|jgi:uncharacterized repeat protein (TIGR01451 family)|nr:MAG: hypothetical protein CVU62_12385 [Deltaproteobacteria bacterium HGW-Deltaproteobacteria-2]
MKAFLHHIAESGFPRGRLLAIAFALVLSLWTAGAMALSPPAGTPIVNKATVQYGDANGNPLSTTSNEVSFPISGAPFLKLEKTADSDPVAPGAVFTYTLRYENTGNTSATGVTVVDTLPVNVTFQSASAGGIYSAATSTVTWNIGNLPSGTGAYLTVTVQVQADLNAGASIVNNASINSSEGITGTSTLTTTVGLGSNIVLEKSGAPSAVAPNGTINYSLSYRNIGNQTAQTVRVTDQIPPGTAYVAGSATAPGILSGGALTWDIGDLTAGSRGELTFQVHVSPLATSGQQITNQASIISTNQTKASNAVVTVVSSQSLMLLKIDSPDPARAGNNLIYTLQVKNAGTIPLTGIVLSDPLPVGTTFVSASGGGIPVAGNRQVNWNIGDLAAGQEQTVTLTVNVDKTLTQGQLIENTATATSNEMAPQTVRAVSGVNARTAGQMQFLNACGGQTVIGYASGDTIYIQVTDLDQNINPAVAETVTVVLTDSATGDAENVILTETGSNTGTFCGSAHSSSSASAPNDGTLSVASNSRIQATYTDSLDASPVSSVSALIDPLGVVFDSIKGTPVSGAVVTLRNWNNINNSCDLTSWPSLPPGQINPAAVTGADGKFAFPLVSPGDYCYQVTPPAGYTFPSAVSDADLPAGFTIGNGSRGDKFTLSAGDPALIRDIPVDPPLGRLVITKTVNKTSAAIGDLVIYTLKLENKGDAPVTNIKVSDVMPHGISYISTSSLINGNATADPKVSSGRTFTWSNSGLAPNKSLEITYRAVVGPDAQMGTGINTVTASGTSLGKTIVSNRAFVEIKITEGVFTSKGTIIGRVFIDRDGDGLAKKNTGIPDVALYLEDGTRVITDKSGKFSITGVVPGTHVLRLDETSLPKGMIPKPLSNRFMHSGTSQFVDMKPSGLFKANFAVDKKNFESLDKPATVAEVKEKTTTVIEQSDRKVEETQREAATLISAPSAPDAENDDLELTSPVKKTEITPPVVSAGLKEKEHEKANETTLENSKEVTSSSPASAEVFQTGSSKDEKIAQPELATARKETPVANDQAAKEEVLELPLEKQIMKMTPDLEFLSPIDNSISGRKNIRVLVKASTDTSLTLSVNGGIVDKNHIGKQIKYELGHVVIYEFVDIRLIAGEENIITAEIKDQFGIERGKKQIRVEATGEPTQVVINTDRTEAEADGLSKIAVNVSLEDSRGHIVPYAAAITVDVTAGEIQEKDADPANDGHQIMCQAGIAHFTIIAPRETGSAKINVQINDLNKSVDVYFVPHLRPMFVVGIGEIVLGHGNSSGDLSYLKHRSTFGDGTYLNGRGAFFLKGNIYKDVLLTAAYDSDKKRTDELFRESDTRVDTEEKYPIYGDESKVGYEALSRENLYVKLEKGKSYLLYGDYRTDLTETKLSAYTRSFNGLKFEVNTEKFRLRSFGTHTDQGQFIDTLPGKGISGYYYLTHYQIIDGSERVVIETRDRLQPDRVLNRELKSRGSDYEIDYGLGTILFNVAIPSYDSDGNPLYIVTTYESRQDGDQYYIYGGRGAYKITDQLEVGATGIVEENSISDYNLFGGDVTLRLPGSTILKAEYARTRGLFDISSSYVPQDGEGWSFDLESKPLKQLMLKGYYRDLSDYFSNPSASDAVRGTSKIGLEAAYEIQPTLTMKAKYLDEKDRINNSSHLLASVGATKKFTKTMVSAELAHETADNLTDTPAQIPYTPGGLLNGVPFFNSYETPERATFLKLAIERELLKDLSLSLSHKQDIGGNGYFLSQGGLNYQLNKSNKLYIREEYAKYQDGTQTRTLIGAESQVVKNTTAYTEYRLADGSAGYRNEQVIGLKNKLQVMEGVTANIAGEYLTTLSGQKNPNQPDAYAAAVGLEYLPKEDFKLTGRLEHRNEIDGDKSSYLAEISSAYKLNPDYSLLLRERYFLEKNGSSDNHTSRFLVGLAYRPLDNDRFNALGKIEYKYNRQSASSPNYTINSFIVSTEGVYQFNPKIQLMGKYAGKLEIDDSFNSYTDLVAARILYDLTDRFDVGVEYRMLTSHLTNTRLHGGSAEVGYRVIDQLWLSLGYCFDRFDEDLTGDSYYGEGPYLKLRFKFDETTLRKIKSSAVNSR